MFKLEKKINKLEMNVLNNFIVMQGRTYKEEKEAGIIWSPQFDKGGNTPHSWERMKDVKKGDMIFHYVNGSIVAISIATANCIESDKPTNLQNKTNWNQEGYMAMLSYHELEVPLRISDHFNAIQPLLPLKYSAFQDNAQGNQGYLYPCNDDLTIELLEFIGETNLIAQNKEQLSFSMDSIEFNNDNPLAPIITKTESEAKAKIRLGQNRFREKLEPIWNNNCPVCGINLRDILRASHAKPWKDSTNEERLDPYNGILLCCNHDSLYDRGYISFDPHGNILISKEIAEDDYSKYGLSNNIKITTTTQHKPYFKWHIKNKFKG